MRANRACLARGVLVGVVILVVIGSLLPGQWEFEAAPIWFNAAHVPAYFLLTALGVWCGTACSRAGSYRLLSIGAAVYLFGLVVEALQPLVGRTFSMTDLAMNAVGVTAALSFVWFVRCRPISAS